MSCWITNNFSNRMFYQKNNIHLQSYVEALWGYEYMKIQFSVFCNIIFIPKPLIYLSPTNCTRHCWTRAHFAIILRITCLVVSLIIGSQIPTNICPCHVNFVAHFSESDENETKFQSHLDLDFTQQTKTRNLKIMFNLVPSSKRVWYDSMFLSI